MPTFRRQLVVWALFAGVWGAAAPVEGGEHEGLTAVRHDLRLAFTVAGKVARVHVQRGQKVATGDVLVELDDTQMALEEQLRQLRAGSDLTVKAKEEELNLARTEERRLGDLLQQSAAAPVEFARAQIRTRIAELELKLARQKQQETELEYRQVQSRRREFVLRAPEAGSIEELVVHGGESVDVGKPVLRLVVTDPLLVEVWVPLEEAAGLRTGDTGVVWAGGGGAAEGEGKAPVRGGGAGQRLGTGRVTFIAAVAEAGSKTRLVQLEMGNPGLLPGGMPVRVEFDRRGAGGDGAGAGQGRQGRAGSESGGAPVARGAGGEP